MEVRPPPTHRYDYLEYYKDCCPKRMLRLWLRRRRRYRHPPKKPTIRRFLFLAVLFTIPEGAVSGERQGPRFTSEPAHLIEFSNRAGVAIECRAHASPPARIEWLKFDATRVERIHGLREVSSNGTLYFPPFSEEVYRQDVHDTTYQCRASNALGTILSRIVQIRAVVTQAYDINIFDDIVIPGNTGVLRCDVSPYATDFVIVTSWVESGHHNIYPNTDNGKGGKYLILPTGELYVFHVSYEDSSSTFSCRTVNRLTGETYSSEVTGKLLIPGGEPKETPLSLKVQKKTKKNAKLGEVVYLTCLSHGYPLPSYRWFKEEKEKLSPIIGNDRFFFINSALLIISKARYEDSGNYICRVNNTLGEEEIQITLSVKAPLSVHLQPPSQTVDMGKSASIVCNPAGFPVTKVAWYKDGKPLKDDKRYNISTNPHKIFISPIEKDSQGMYQCFALNEWDMAQATAEIQLGDASPELTYYFSEQTLQPGPPISLKCVATGNPPPQFTWSLDGFPIPDSPRFLVGQYVTVHDDVVSHVNISSLKEEDGGEYTCSARNTVDKVFHSARINVYGPPFIRIMPKITAIAGNDLIIQCPVAGFPIESITWERDGSLLPFNRRQRVYANGTLVIENAQRNIDAGTYTCQAQNRQKVIARRDVEVQVLLPPKILPLHAMTNILREGMRAAISCQVLEGDLPLSFKWLKDGKDDLGDDVIIRRLDEYSTSLVIDHIESIHNGNYTCIVVNIAGTESYSIALSVNVPPKWTVEPVDANVVLGQTIRLDCVAEGHPSPSMSWKKSVGKTGSTAGEYKDFIYEPNVKFYENGSVEFVHISKENQGHYLCEAKNTISNIAISKLIFLNVHSPAFFPQKSKQVYVEKDGPAHLQCTALGDNPIGIVWKIGTQRIAEDFDPRYSIREQLLDEGMVSELGISHVFRHDTTVFNCHANNDYGQDEMSIHLIVQEIPEIPKNIRAIDRQSRSVQLTWIQPYAGNSPITSYVIQYKLITEPWENNPSKIVVPGTQTVASVSNLHPATSYHLRIIAENKLGFSDPSEVAQVTTQEEEPSGFPVEVHAEAKSSTEIYVMWEAPPKETWNGVLLGYYVGYSEVGTTIPSPPPSQHTHMKTVEVGSQYGGQTVLENLQMYTAYIISVQAFNIKGAGPHSNYITTRTNEGVPSLPPEKVSCLTVASNALDVWWEPPLAEGRNGLIIGYKVYYHPAEDWYEETDPDTKSTNKLRMTVSGLLKHTNYSLAALAYTETGDGVLSSQIYCRTSEDVPSPPAGIKAGLKEKNKIAVSWLPPKLKNGIITSYTIYMGIIDHGKEGGTHKHIISPLIEYYETDQVVEGVTYQFWVTASTSVGEGKSTRVVTVSPLNKFPGKIMSFSLQLTSPYKKNVTMPCKVIGSPTPWVVWRFNGKGIENDNKKYWISKNGVLTIRDVQKFDQGNYSCTAENAVGGDTIVYQLVVRVPPEPPVLHVTGSETNSLHLKWSNKANSDTPILGYIIHYKRDNYDWEELQLKAKVTSHVLTNLWCGTRYKLYMTAYNRIATGLPCDIVNAKTKGAAPVKPSFSSGTLLSYNSSTITIWLDSWSDGGCPILYFTIEYREAGQSEWKIATNNILPQDRAYTIVGLKPATRYFVKMTAVNSAGSTKDIKNVTLLSIDGSPVVIKEVVSDTNTDTYWIGSRVILPIIILIIVSVLFGYIYFKKRKEVAVEQPDIGLGESLTIAQMQNQHNRDQQYAVQGAQQLPALPPMNIEPSSFKPRTSSGNPEDVCPYATYNIKPDYAESSFSGTVYSGPYHSVRGSFVYHDVHNSQAGTSDRRQMREPEYTKVRRRSGGRLRETVLESQESDNLGSTDSEVKKILHLHCPISQPPTPPNNVSSNLSTYECNSDSEEASRRTSSQELMFRLSRDTLPGPEETSSSASDKSSLTAGLRKHSTHSRRSKGKPLQQSSSIKMPARSGSGYSDGSSGNSRQSTIGPSSVAERFGVTYHSVGERSSTDHSADRSSLGMVHLPVAERPALHISATERSSLDHSTGTVSSSCRKNHSSALGNSVISSYSNYERSSLSRNDSSGLRYSLADATGITNGASYSGSKSNPHNYSSSHANGTTYSERHSSSGTYSDRLPSNSNYSISLANGPAHPGVHPNGFNYSTGHSNSSGYSSNHRDHLSSSSFGSSSPHSTHVIISTTGGSTRTSSSALERLASFSNHTEETSFCYPPSRFSDGCLDDIAPSRYRRGARPGSVRVVSSGYRITPPSRFSDGDTEHPASLNKEAGNYRLERESTFQIDV